MKAALLLAATAITLMGPPVAAAAPFGNTVLGPTPAPITLEYFTALDCPACEQFEREVLPQLLGEALGNAVRVVIRQLPAAEPARAAQARALLCLPGGADYLPRRAEFKHSDPTASGCRSDRAAQGVLDFNAAVFRAAGFRGTPAFVLTRHAGAAAVGRRTWAGRTTWRDWQAELSQLPAGPPQASPR